MMTTFLPARLFIVMVYSLADCYKTKRVNSGQ
jgi:hypothetical protein